MESADPGKATRVAGGRYRRTRRGEDTVVVETWTGKLWHCDHGKQRSHCKPCGGNSICQDQM